MQGLLVASLAGSGICKGGGSLLLKHTGLVLWPQGSNHEAPYKQVWALLMPRDKVGDASILRAQYTQGHTQEGHTSVPMLNPLSFN